MLRGWQDTRLGISRADEAGRGGAQTREFAAVTKVVSGAGVWVPIRRVEVCRAFYLRLIDCTAEAADTATQHQP